jgi:hypothetical protein
MKDINIEYKLTKLNKWKILKLKVDWFKRSDTYCTEWYAEEIQEYFFATEPSIKDFHEDVELKVNFWNDIVIPLYEHFELKKVY